jgi:hypothetical protein
MNNTHSRASVSILIPAYNAQEWIADTLRSALAQTWKAKEIIVVDDGSTDRTLSIARGFESAGVRVFTQKNQGAAVARNAAFAHSRGDYIHGWTLTICWRRTRLNSNCDCWAPSRINAFSSPAPMDAFNIATIGRRLYPRGCGATLLPSNGCYAS